MSDEPTFTRHFDWLSHRSGLTPTDKVIYERIVRYGELFKKNYVSMERLAYHESVSVSTVERSIKKLARMKLIGIKKEGRKNIYTILDHPWMHEPWPEYESPQSAEETRQSEDNTPQSDGLIPVNLTTNTPQDDGLREYARESSKKVSQESIEDSRASALNPEVSSVQEEWLDTDNTHQIDGIGESVKNSGLRNRISNSLLELEFGHYKRMFDTLSLYPKDLVAQAKIEYRLNMKHILKEFGIEMEDYSEVFNRLASSENLREELVTYLVEQECEIYETA